MELQWQEGKQELFYFSPQEERNTAISIKMIEHNRIPGLLPMHRQYIDNQIQFIYETQGCYALQEMLGKQPVSVSWACRILQQVLEAVSVGETYLLNRFEYYVCSEAIFLDKTHQQILMCYTPGLEHDIHQGFQGLMETIMEHLDHRNKKEIALFYGIYDMHCSAEVSFAELQEHFERCGKKMQNGANSIQAFPEEIVMKASEREGKTEKSLAKTETTFCFVRYEHWKMGKKKSYAVDVLPERFVLPNGRYAVGRRQDQALLLLPQQISREHAVLEVERKQVYLTDCGSSNGTYVNGRKISAHVKTRLNTGDVITFADISYQLN